jgi:hypothetical protein
LRTGGIALVARFFRVLQLFLWYVADPHDHWRALGREGCAIMHLARLTFVGQPFSRANINNRHDGKDDSKPMMIMKPSFGLLLLLVILAALCQTILADPSFGLIKRHHHSLDRAAVGRAKLLSFRNSEQHHQVLLCLRGGATAAGQRSWWIPSGYHPYGYQITALGEEFLSFPGSLECDLGRFLASLKTRKTTYALKNAWLEVIRNSKTAQALNVYKNIDRMLQYCLKAKLID